MLLIEDGRAINIFFTHTQAVRKTIHLHVPGTRHDLAGALRIYEHHLGLVVSLHDGDGGTEALVTLLVNCVIAYE